MTELQTYTPNNNMFLNMSMLFATMFIYILYLLDLNKSLRNVIGVQSKVIERLSVKKEASSQTVPCEPKKYLIPSYHVFNFEKYMFYNSSTRENSYYDIIYGFRVREDPDFPGYFTFAVNSNKILKNVNGYIQVVDFENPQYPPSSWISY